MMLLKQSGKGERPDACCYRYKCRVINVSTRIDVCRDPDDSKFIECAVDSKCYYVISGDKDL